MQAAQETQAALKIGDAYGGGFFTGITRDPDTGKRYRNITAGAAHELVGAYGEYGQKIEGASSFTDSRANTEAMAATGSELAKQVLALEIGGFTDWAIPARDVQELQYRHFKPTVEQNYCWNRDGENHNSLPVGELYTEESPAQTTVEAFKAGGTEAFQSRWYWSSTQRSAGDAFHLTFEVGHQHYNAKSHELRVRPVRSELID